ncbi:MAG: DegT/DnrJ/EryC1/StrS family aminotransferase, partial [Butyrivibrio sp.]|nr:DegT/DnrJ/EryC1/StrS family aminotransferase [Butyrivibrio sp.]
GFGRRIKLNTCFYDDNCAYLQKAIDSEQNYNFVDELENKLSSYLGGRAVLTTNTGTGSMHMAIKLAASIAYGSNDYKNKRVFCSDLCPIEQAMPILYEGMIPTFIDSGYTDFNIDPESLNKAFELYSDTKIVIINHLYGFPGNVFLIKKICEEHGAILIENASEAFGARVDGKAVGTIGDIGVFDFGKGKIISADSGGAIAAGDKANIEIVRSLADMSKEKLPWNHHNCIGYDYRMSNITAAVISSQLPHIDEVISGKRHIFERYRDNLNEDLIYLNNSDENIEPNYWRPMILCDSSINAKEKRSENGYSYEDIHGTSSPMEIIDALDAFGADAAPLYMPMSMQPLFKSYELISLEGKILYLEPYNTETCLFSSEVSRDASRRGLCLPSDMTMTEEEQFQIIEIVNACFSGQSIDRDTTETVMMACGM